ncbi:hypothetical protein [Halobacillus amylolyticus]|uniref:HPP family protein n=1 Tax=Halobacillus amylolyticus TaxID=2932259 RepID=A0ABY4HB82_9BACI|nr:hypothetical protein [Halobacillus amylolyticus]UOR12111.1 hypothetical protein MUO15_00765 [Halobacillus amylolyticus]
MNKAILKNVTIISYVIAITFIITMITASVMLNNHQIILPELAAMAIAMWVYREAGWIRQPSKILFAPSLTAVIGFMVNLLPISYVGKVGITLMLLMLLLRLIRSNLAPSIATGLLPVVIDVDGWSFIISTFILTFILMLGVLLFRLNNGLEKKVKIQYKYMVVFLALNFVWIGLTWAVGYPQLAAIPPILITLINMILMYILLRIVGVRIPAVYAFPLLPFIFPDKVVAMLPLGSLVTCVFLFSSVLAYKKVEIKQREKRVLM